MEMFIYRALNEKTKLYNLGIVIADTKEKAEEIVCKKFDIEKYSIYVFSKESICYLFGGDILNNKCIDVNEICFMGYKTENEMKLQRKLDAIQPLIDDLALWRSR